MTFLNNKIYFIVMNIYIVNTAALLTIFIIMNRWVVEMDELFFEMYIEI
jgi:hypothetical protein